MKSSPRAHVMSFAATQELKDRIIKQANKNGLRISRFVTNTLEEKLNEIDSDETSLPE